MAEASPAHSEQYDALGHALAAVSRALEGARLLGVDHPATVRACEAAAAAWVEGARIAVTPAAFEVGGVAVPGASSCRTLHERLRELDIAIAELAGPGTTGAVAGLVSALAERGDVEGVVRAVNAAGAVRLTRVDYSRLTASSEVGGAGGDAMISLVHSMLAGDAPSRAAAIEAKYPAGGETAFAGEFARTAEWVESLRAEEQPAAITSLTPLLATLSDRFRTQLLSPGNTNPASWRVLASMAAAIPKNDIERALRSLSEKPVQLSVEAAAVFAKLASTLPAGNPEAPTARAVTGVACEVLCADEHNLAQRLESVLRVHQGEEFSPADYRANIMHLAASTVSPGGHTACKAAFENEALSMHFGHTVLSVWLLRTEKAGVAESLARHADAVLAAEGPGVFLNAAERAGAPAGLTELLRSPAFFAAALSHPGCGPEDRSRLVARGGEEQLTGLLALLSESPNRAARAAAGLLLNTLGESEVRRVLSGVGGAAPALAALSLVPELGCERGRLVCHAFLAHAEPGLRAEALQTHVLVGAPTDAMYGEALRDASDEVAARALQLLAADARGFDITARALEVCVQADSRFDMIAQAMISRGDAGLARAARVLTGFTASPDRGRASLADRLSAHLRPHAANTEVARVLRRYRLSLSRLVAFMFPEGSARQSKGRSAA